MKTITLYGIHATGLTAVIDDVDYEMINKFRWNVTKRKHGYYAVTKISGTNCYMHRLIINPCHDNVVDHKDHNGLNNQRENLRVCSRQENSRNRRPTHKTSKFLGVSFHKFSKKWRAATEIKGVHVEIGRFNTEIEAALAYDQYVKKNYGEFASPNFKD